VPGREVGPDHREAPAGRRIDRRGRITGEHRLDEFSTPDQLVATYLKGDE